MFFAGQKVVCIDGKFPLGIENLYVALPQEGKTYTIRALLPGTPIEKPTAEGEELAVYLQEIVNPKSGKAPFRERGFKAERFRPLQELTTEDIIGQSEPVTTEFAAGRVAPATTATNIIDGE